MGCTEWNARHTLVKYVDPLQSSVVWYLSWDESKTWAAMFLSFSATTAISSVATSFKNSACVNPVNTSERHELGVREAEEDVMAYWCPASTTWADRLDAAIFTRASSRSKSSILGLWIETITFNIVFSKCYNLKHKECQYHYGWLISTMQLHNWGTYSTYSVISDCHKENI